MSRFTLLPSNSRQVNGGHVELNLEIFSGIFSGKKNAPVFFPYSSKVTSRFVNSLDFMLMLAAESGLNLIFSGQSWLFGILVFTSF